MLLINMFKVSTDKSPGLEPSRGDTAQAIPKHVGSALLCS